VLKDSERRYSIASRAAPSVPITAFTEQAREAVVLAQAAANVLDQDGLSTEHLLLGLLSVKDGLASRVLGSFDVTAELVRNQLLAMGTASTPRGAVEDITVTPRARRVLELALREAIVLGFSAAGTEHILLALIREHECVAAGILRAFVPNAAPEIRYAVIRALSDTQPHMLRTQAVPFQATPRSVS
jgi:ATP-dependent Clp protease ATP-binding subunit ClpC